MKSRHLITLSLLVLLPAFTGCSLIQKIISSKDNVHPPRELTEFTPTVQVQRLWKESVGDGAGRSGIRLRPAYADGKLYVASVDGKLAALDAATGKTIWENDTRTHGLFGYFGKKKHYPDALYAGGPSVNGDLMVVGTLDGHVYGLDAATGKQRWAAELSDEVVSAPTIDGGLVYARTNDGRIYALDAATGARKWVNDQAEIPLLSLRGNGPVLVAHGVVFYGSDDGKIVALRSDTGSAQWQQQLAKGEGRSDIEKLDDADGSLQLDGDTLFADAYHGSLVSVNAPDGKVNWNRPFSSYVGVAIAGKQVIGIDEDSQVWAMDASTGADVWKQDELEYRWLTGPAVQGRYAVVGDLQGYVHWLNLADGKLAARERLSRDAIRARPLVVGDTVFVEDETGTIGAYRIAGSP
ncbi:MAG TPA: outer membrane protein assembly factor BamB [Rhodanobacteraceae bacterium]|nr:outer membrane protein assembly factor BamB [Rhodanobacteraceae bacterium]